MNTQDLPYFEELLAFLEQHYSPPFFNKEGEWAAESYGVVLAQEHMRALQRHGVSSISRFVAAKGQAVWFNGRLEVLAEKPMMTPAQVHYLKRGAGRTHLPKASAGRSAQARLRA